MKRRSRLDNRSTRRSSVVEASLYQFTGKARGAGSCRISYYCFLANFLSTATCRKRTLLLAKPGFQPLAPGATSDMTPACAPISARSPIRRCPVKPACPPTRTKSPITVEPEIPTCATMTQHRPSTTLWPICTRLSRREPAPITVSCDDPRSIVVLAPTSTSSSRMTRPSWGTERNPSWCRRTQTLPARSELQDRHKHVLPKARG